MSLDQTDLTDIASRADRFRDDGRWLPAAILYGKLLENIPSSMHLWVQYAHMLKEAELFEEAVKAYKLAVVCDRTEPDPRLHLAHLLKRLGRIPEALETFRGLSALPDAPSVEQEIAGLRIALMQLEPKAAAVFVPKGEGAEISACLAGFVKLQSREQARLTDISDGNGAQDLSAESTDMSGIDVLWIVKERELRARLDPKANIVIRGGCYVATTKNPQFSIVVDGEPLLPGWFAVEIALSAQVMVFNPVLYVEHRFEWSRFSTFHLKPVGEGKFRAIGFLEDAVLRLRLDPADCEGGFNVTTFGLRQISLVQSFRQAHRLNHKAVRMALSNIKRHKSIRQFSRDIAQILYYPGADAYEKWIAKHDTPSDEELARHRRAVARWKIPPLISALVSVDAANSRALEETLQSLKDQTYGHWQLHVVVAPDVPKATRRALSSYSESDARVIPVFAQEALTMKSALESSAGHFVLFLTPGDSLAPSALYRIVECHFTKPLSRLMYSDEDSIEEGRRYSPLFKPDWDPDYFQASNYVGQSVIFDAELARACCPPSLEFQNVDVHELVLRASEILAAEQVTHIPRVLYHRQAARDNDVNKSALPYPLTDQRRRALDASFARQNKQAATGGMPGNLCRVIWPVPNPAPLVTLIIPTRDYAQLLQGCIESIRTHTSYQAFEIIVVDNDSVEPETQAYFDELRRQEDVRVLKAPGPFNFSRLNNLAVNEARGSLIGLVNNDILAIGSGWLREMVSHAVRPDVGAVGAKLLYKTGHIQHAGIVCGIGLVAGHPHKYRAADDLGYMGRIVSTQTLSAVTAACLMVEKAKYLQVGGMDEDNLRVAFNDVDLCLKLDAAGYRNIYTPHATLVHLESVSRGLDTTPDKVIRYKSEAAFMQSKWGDKIKQDRFYNVNLTTDREDFSIGD